MNFNITYLPKPYQKILLFDLSEIDFVFSNFLCQNVQTTVGGGGVRAKSERPNFLRPYLPNGGRGGQRRFGQCPKFGSLFFLMAPLSLSKTIMLDDLSHPY